MTKTWIPIKTWCTISKNNPDCIAGTRSRNDKNRDEVWECDSQHSGEAYRGDSGVSGLDVLVLVVLTTTLLLVLPQFNKDGVWALAKRFPVRSRPNRCDVPRWAN